MNIESPQSFIVSEECRKAVWPHGHRDYVGEKRGWVSYSSATAPSIIHLAASGEKGPWFLALEHRGVIAELDLTTVEMPGPGLSRYAFSTLKDLYEALYRVYQLAIRFPNEPSIVPLRQSPQTSPASAETTLPESQVTRSLETMVQEFREQTADMPSSTEVERLVIQRIGQDSFRLELMKYWQCSCPLTNITDPELLRASHIVPWKDCTSVEDRLDVHNGLLLSALWDAAFDRGLVTFSDEGKPQFSPRLSKQAQENMHWTNPIPLTKHHQERLVWHRAKVFLSTAGG